MRRIPIYSRTGRVVVVNIKGAAYMLQNGHGNEELAAFAEGNSAYVLTYAHGLPFVALARFDLADVDASGHVAPAAEVAGQEWQVEEMLGPRGTYLREATMVQRLMEYL